MMGKKKLYLDLINDDECQLLFAKITLHLSIINSSVEEITSKTFLDFDLLCKSTTEPKSESRILLPHAIFVYTITDIHTKLLLS